MRPPLRTVALVVAIALGLVAAVPPARADLGRPEWNAGDYWVYSFNGTFFTGAIFAVTGPGTFRMDVIGQDTVTVGAANYPSYRVRLDVNSTGATVVNSGEQWYRTSDLALVRSVVNVTADIPFFGTFIILATVTFDPPLGVQWPLVTSGNWTTSSDVTLTNQVFGGPVFPPNTNTVDRSYVVQVSSQVNVAAGGFDTTPLRWEDASGYGVVYWSGAGNAAREQEFAPNDQETYSSELQEYRYQGALFLGLPLVVWLLILLLVVIVVIALVMRRRRMPMAGPPMPPASPP